MIFDQNLEKKLALHNVPSWSCSAKRSKLMIAGGVTSGKNTGEPVEREVKLKITLPRPFTGASSSRVVWAVDGNLINWTSGRRSVCEKNGNRVHNSVYGGRLEPISSIRAGWLTGCDRLSELTLHVHKIHSGPSIHHSAPIQMKAKHNALVDEKI